jgi:nucleoside-diphosphate-sugar epimerase
MDFMKILVTGAKGFIGQEIVSELSKSNFEVFKVGNNKLNNSKFKSENYKDFSINIADEQAVKSLQEIGEVDVVIHCAGLAHQFGNIGKEDFFTVNVAGTRNICNVANELRAKHFILISSVAVYGKVKNNNKQGIDETFECQPMGDYAESKFEAEKIARQICENNKIPLTILRPATVIGEEDAGNVRRLIEAIDKKRFIWIGKGENLKSLIYKRDVARACLAVLKRKTPNTEILNVSAEALKMKNIVSLIANNLGRKVPKIFIPENILKSIFQIGFKISKVKKLQNFLETVEKWTDEDVYLSNKIKSVYDFTPETSVSEAIALEVDWYKNNR